MNFTDLIASCDIYDLADGWIHRATGQWVRVEWEQQENGPRGIDVERELNRVGVDIAGRWFAPASKDHPYGLLSCLVPKPRARWAEYALTAYGIPFVSEPIDAKSVAAAQRRQGQPIPAWSERGQHRPSVTLSEMNFAAPKKEDGPVKKLVKWLRDGKSGER